MPDLQTACAALTAWAREQCEACKQQRLIDVDGFFYVGQTKCREANDYHTCHKYIELARDVVMAGVGTAMECPPQYQDRCNASVLQCVECWQAELNQMLGETTDG